MSGSSTSGVLGVEQLDLSAPPYERLRASVASSEALRAAVAYWTLDPAFVSPRVVRLLAHPDGFLVADLQLPTSIRRLDAMVGDGANVHLHLGRAAWHVGSKDSETGVVGWGPRESRALMHSKMLLFECADGTAEIWTGSLNWTNPAIRGVNLESSLILTVERGCPIYEQTLRHLMFARAIAERFDRAKVEWYLSLQGASEEEEVRLIELEGRNVAHLAGSAIVVFSGRRSVRMPAVRSAVFVRVFDSQTEEEHFYRAEVLQSGSLAAANHNAGGTSIQGKRYAFKRRGTLPILLEETTPPPSVLDSAFGWATLELIQHLAPGTTAIPVLGEEAWTEVETLPVFEGRLRAEDRAAFGPERMFAKLPAWDTLQAAIAPSLADRRVSANESDEGGSMFSRHVLREPRR